MQPCLWLPWIFFTHKTTYYLLKYLEDVKNIIQTLGTLESTGIFLQQVACSLLTEHICSYARVCFCTWAQTQRLRIGPRHADSAVETWGAGLLCLWIKVPTPVFWPGESHKLYSPWGCKESDTTERLSLYTLVHSQVKFISHMTPLIHFTGSYDTI